MLKVETKDAAMSANSNGKIKVLIVDDQEVIREAFGLLLEGEPTIDLVGVFGDAQSAIEMMETLKPDVVILDIKMPNLNGVEAAKIIRELHEEVGIILLSAYDNSEYIREFLQDKPGGKSYLLKNTLGTMDELVRTIQDVAVGRTVIDPIVMQSLTPGKVMPDDSPLQQLTRREMEVLSLVAKACTNSSIADILVIQPRTVEHHINNIFGKLGISDSGQHARVQATIIYSKFFNLSNDD